MNLTAEIRTNILKLFNIAEASRILKLDDRQLRQAINAGLVEPPSFQLGKRKYFAADALTRLTETLNQKSRQ